MKSNSIRLRRWFNGVLCFVLAFVLSLSVAAANVEVTVTVTDGANDVSIYTQNDVEVPIDETTHSISVEPGTYKYTAANGAAGQFEVTSETTQVTFASVCFEDVTPSFFSITAGRTLYLPDLGELTISNQRGDITYSHAAQDGENGTAKEYYYVLPQYNGDAYYNYVFTPNDENYLTIDGHFYVYGDSEFAALNLSDSGRIPYIKADYITVKAPVDMKVQTVWQLKFYTARNFKTYEVSSTDGEYNYYSIPSGLTLRLSQDGKVTRYGSGEQVGTWNEDKTILTLRELQDNPNQITRDVGSYYASMMTNLPLDSEINLEVGEYFDLVPLRAWQAIDNGGSNGHQDPDWHYVVIGGDNNVVSIAETEDDVTGQFGRIQANGEGVALVAFYYDAMESANQTDNDEYGLYTWSALWPELTGIAVVNVSDGNSGTEITTNIDLTEGKTIYYISSQTTADGKTSEMDDHAEYTFKPTASTGGVETSITSVRVFEPLMVANGELNRNPNNWLTATNWKTYTPDSNGYYTLNLTEGRNVVEIKAGDAVAYHVILARGLDITIENAYNPGEALAVGDTATLTYNGILPPLFKMGAIYNPSGVYYYFNGNGVETSATWGQYLPSATVSIELTEEDVGTYTLADGYLSSPAWGENANAHRALTRNSMAGTWSGSDSDEHANDKVAIVPDVSFEVTSNDDLEEVTARNAGWLQGLTVIPAKNTNANPLNMKIYSAGNPVPQSISFATTLPQQIGVGAVPFDAANTKLLARYWSGTDSTNAVVEEIQAADIVYSTNDFGGTTTGITLQFLKQNLKLNPNTNPQVNVEIIVIPDNGYPMTYGCHLFHNAGLNRRTINAILTDLEIVPLKGSFGRFDGVLEANDITYTDKAGNAVMQDLGYGFIGTESNFETSVPYETSEIALNAVGSGSLGKTIEIVVNGNETTTYAAGDAIELQQGENILVITYKPVRGETQLPERTYTVVINRAYAPGYVTFDVPAGAEVTVKKSGKTQEAFATNTNTGVFMYELPGGTYTYSVELEGYYTKTGTFTAPTEEKIVVALEDMHSLPGCSGSFQVSIHGQKDEVCALTTMAIPEEAEDLLAKKYVTYNYGGYTVLHALLDACENAGVSFKCSKGVLTPSTTVDNSLTASGAGWVCEVNGEVVEPFSTLVEAGDVIRFYYNNNSTGMTHAWFDEDTLTATRGSAVTVTLMGADVENNGSSASAISGATILVDGKAVGTTDYTGKATITTDDLMLGSHTITASKEVDGVNILTYAQVNLTLNKAVDADTDPSTTEVTFRLIGDNKHSTSSHKYTTWIATETYTFAASSVSVADVFDLALECAGLEHDDFSDNYVAWINAPESLGGYKLSEKDNGSNSGWQYTVNGVHPSYGVNDFDVTSGDEIIFHYVDDYTTEETEFTWLAAADVNPEGIAPVIPSEPVVPDQPSEPDDPTDPDNPSNPDDPDDPEDPVVPDSLNIPESIKEMYEKTAATLLSKTPTCGNGVSTLSDWMLFGLVRSTVDIPDSYKETYLTAAKTYVNTMDTSGQLDETAPTENMRVALALTALGYDPTNFEGKNLIQALEDTSWVTGQGNNASAFALLAMDACGHVSSDASVRQTYINSLISSQNSEGGWAISGTDGTDQDTTMMVVTALAPYYETSSEVKTAVDKALSYIKTKQTSDGGFGTTAEGNAQVIVALTALGIDPDSADWANSNGNTVIDALDDYFTSTSGNGFMHDSTLPKYNQMASEQSFYAMVAYIRYLNDQPALYDMGAADSWPEDSEGPDQSGAYTITVFAENGTVTAPASANADELIEVTVEADTGYVISEFNVLSAGTAEEVTVYESGDSYFFFMPENDVWLVATFETAVVEDIAGAMADLTVSDADKETYLLIQQLQAAYDALTAEDYAAMTDEEREELASAYDDFKDEVDEFKEILEEAIEEALDELEDTYDRLDKDEYSSDNWKKIKEIRKQAKSDLKKAAYEEQVEEILEKALDDIEDVTEGGEMEVTFRLIGDFVHDNANDHEGYVTWIETTEYELEAGATVYDLFTMAIDDFDLNERGSSRNYVESIQAPDVLGGYWLGEFDNGRNSGWMYTVNGDHPGYGLQDWELEDGDEVVWHYVDDYTVEEYRETWLEADDISPEEYIEDMLDEILTVGKHGEVDPDELDVRDLGKNVTFRFEPDDGYVVGDVIVDGKSMGSITSYTYKDLQISSRIEVEFEKKAEIDFRDVDEDDWFYEDVEFAVQEGLFEGTSEDRFSPNSSMTRAMLVTVLYRLEGEPNVYGYSSFSDARNNQWYTDAVIWATRNGIVTGYDNGLFGTNDNVTREQMAAILYRYADYKGYDNYGSTSLYQYSDRNKISGYAVNAMKWANAEGLITGRTYSTLAPQGTATRAEVATILHRFVEYIVR